MAALLQGLLHRYEDLGSDPSVHTEVELIGLCLCS